MPSLKHVLDELSFYIQRQPQTFFGLDAAVREEGVNIVGIPLDDTVSHRPGTRFAPSVLRLVSQYVEFSSSRGLQLPREKIADAGDVVLFQGQVEQNVIRIRHVAELLLQLKARLLLIGGEHTLTLPIASVIAESSSELILVVLDSHLDLREEWPAGQKISHATYLRRLLERYGNVQVVHVGAHAADKEEWEYVESLRDRLIVLNPEDTHPGLVTRAVKTLCTSPSFSLYISIDLDVLDPAYMHAVSNPEGFGLPYEEVVNIMSALMRAYGERIRAVDIVEYCPLVDPGYACAMRVLKLMLDVLCELPT